MHVANDYSSTDDIDRSDTRRERLDGKVSRISSTCYSDVMAPQNSQSFRISARAPSFPSHTAAGIFRYPLTCNPGIPRCRLGYHRSSSKIGEISFDLRIKIERQRTDFVHEFQLPPFLSDGVHPQPAFSAASRCECNIHTGTNDHKRLPTAAFEVSHRYRKSGFAFV